MDIWVIAAYALGLVVLILLIRFFLLPFKILLKLIYNALLGGVILILFNYLGGLIGFTLALNAVSAFVAGLLGIPGVILLIALKLILA